MDPALVEEENASGQRLLPAQVTSMDPELFEAVTLGNTNHLELCIRGGIDVLRHVTPTKETCIHIAARHGHSEIITFLHTRCPELLMKTNSTGDTPLHVAAASGHLPTLSCLINCAAESKDTEAGRKDEVHKLIRKANEEKNTIMHEAVKCGHLDMVNFLAEKDPELLCMDNYVGESPLHMAVEKGELEIVEGILRKNCYSHNGPNGRTALHSAVIHRNPAIIKLLLEKNRELVTKEDENMRTALHFASTLGFLEVVRMLLEYSTTPSYILDKSGSGPIHLAARFGRIDVIREFLHRCPDLKDLIDGKSQNLLHIAVEHAQARVVKYLLREKKLGGLISGRDKDGNTPLHQAAAIGYPYLVNILVRDKRVDTTILNKKRLRALDIARSRSHESVEDRKELVLATLLNFTVPPYPKSVWKETLLCGVNQRLMTLSWYKDKGNTLLVVATLVATVAFTAGFTLPGGYQGDGAREGMPTLVRLRNFEEFVWWDSMAMYFSMVAMIVLVWVQFTRHLLPTLLLLHFAQILNIIALQCMSLAFVSGLNLTLVENKSLNGDISKLGYAFYIITFAKVIEYLTPIMYVCPSYIYFRSSINHLSANVFGSFNSYGPEASERSFKSNGPEASESGEKNELSLLLLHYK